MFRGLRRVAEVLERVLEDVGSPKRHVPNPQRTRELMGVALHHSLPLLPQPLLYGSYKPQTRLRDQSQVDESPRYGINKLIKGSQGIFTIVINL